MFVTLSSPDNTFDSLFLANYGTIRLKDELARLPGVGSVLVFGAGQSSRRVWLDPDKLRAAKRLNPAPRMANTAVYTTRRNNGCSIDHVKPSTEFL